MDLADYLTKHNLKHSDFARRIGVSQAAVTRYVAGLRMPKPDHLAKIAEVTGGQVTANDFVSVHAREAAQ